MRAVIYLLLHLLTTVAKLFKPGGSRTIERKRRNPRYGCPRIAQQINLAFGLDLDKDTVRGVLAANYTRRVIGFGVHAGNFDGPALCRMFNDATSKQSWPQRISSDNDPLFQYHRWKANLRVLEIEEIKSLPHAPMSHPYVERLIGSVRRELLDQTLFWTAPDLENKLREYKRYYDKHRTHSGRDGRSPDETVEKKVVNINQYRWEKHCRGLFQLPVAA